MTMTYDSIPFVKLVQKILVGKYEPIMDIGRKISVIDLHNLQMLFMVWIKYNFSECLGPCTNMKAPNGRLSGDGSAQARRQGGIRGQLPSKSFSCPQILLCSEKCILNIW